MNMNNISTKKRTMGMLIALIMLITAVCVMTTSQVSAASKTQYRNMEAGDDEKPKEKVGNYYVWVESTYDKNENVTATRLKCAKSLKAEAKILKTVKNKDKTISPTVITNGSTIYYAVVSMKTEKAVIYKTTVKGAKAKKIKTVERFFGLAAYYNGRIYYNKAPGKAGTPVDRVHLYSSKTSGKKTRLEKKYYSVSSSYGKYLTGSSLNFDVSNYPQYLYNVKTRKTKKLPEAVGSVVYGKSVYYYTYNYSTSDYSEKWTVKKCDLSGKKVEKIKTVKNMNLHYFGKRIAYFVNYDTEAVKKLTYKTKTLTTVK